MSNGGPERTDPGARIRLLMGARAAAISVLFIVLALAGRGGTRPGGPPRLRTVAAQTTDAHCPALPDGPCSVACETVDAQAKALVSEMRACQPGDRCVAVDLYTIAGENNCSAPFQCTSGIRAAADLDEFRSRARAIVEARRKCGTCSNGTCIQTCATASCADLGQRPWTCDPTTKRCELAPEPGAP